MKSQADVTLNEEFHRNWSEISSAEYLFDRKQQEIKLLESCDKKSMVDFVTKLIAKSNENRRKLSVQVQGSEVVDENALEDNPNEVIYDLKYHECEDKHFIRDIDEYKKTLETYAIHKIVK